MRRANSSMPSENNKIIRCAIYTRKSTEEGLEQEFNSLDAQRESAEAFITSQQHEGWVCLPDRYDDGGFTGGNMDRPALRRLMADIEAGKVDCVVVGADTRIEIWDAAAWESYLGDTEQSFVELDREVVPPGSTS